MGRVAKIAQIALRGSGVLVMLLGLSMWAGYGLSLLNIHMLLGVIVVLALWTLAGVGAKAGASPVRVIVAVLWGFLVPVLGMMQTQIMPGSAHWVIRLIHLLVGGAAIAQGERLARAVFSSPAGSGGPA
jgi:hypothetical protein